MFGPEVLTRTKAHVRLVPLWATVRVVAKHHEDAPMSIVVHVHLIPLWTKLKTLYRNVPR